MKKQMIKRYSLFTSFMLIGLLSYPATIKASPIEVSLQQAMDADCNGIAEEESLALPGACIIYSITTTNTSDATIYNLSINGKIPEHTRLYQNIAIKNNILTRQSTQIEKRNRTIKSNIGKLEPGKHQAVVLSYVVQILEGNEN